MQPCLDQGIPRTASYAQLSFELSKHPYGKDITLNPTTYSTNDPSALPTVSVVVPVYNVERYLAQCLESLACQASCVQEIICVDDGSTDGSPQILDDAQARVPRLRVVHRANGGYGSAVNEGISLSSGTYVGIVEPDDFVTPACYKTLCQAAQAHGTPDIVKAAYWRVCEAGAPNEHVEPCFYLGKVRFANQPFTIYDDAELLLHHPSIWSAIYRRDFLQDNGISFVEAPGAGWTDNPFLMETMLAARSIVYLDERFTITGVLRRAGGRAQRPLRHRRPMAGDGRHRTPAQRLKRRRPGSALQRGCSYLEMLLNDFDRSDPLVRSCIARMQERINPQDVKRFKRILPSYKAAYERSLPLAKRLAYRLSRG